MMGFKWHLARLGRPLFVIFCIQHFWNENAWWWSSDKLVAKVILDFLLGSFWCHMWYSWATELSSTSFSCPITSSIATLSNGISSASFNFALPYFGQSAYQQSIFTYCKHHLYLLGFGPSAWMGEYLSNYQLQWPWIQSDLLASCRKSWNVPYL